MSDLDRQASTADVAEPAFQDDDICKKCGGSMEWVDCWQIDCEDGWYDLGEEDPINYSHGDLAKCSTCNGEGGWMVCDACAKTSPQSESGNG